MNDVVFWVLWGQKYAEIFTRLSLPSLLSDGNFPSYSNLSNTEFILLTRQKDGEEIERSAAWSCLAGLAKARIIPIPDVYFEDRGRYAALAGLQRKMINYAHIRDAGLFFPQPDGIYGDGAIRSIDRAKAAGKAAFMGSGVRCSRLLGQKIVAHLEETGQGDPTQTGRISLPPLRLADWMVKTLSVTSRTNDCHDSPHYSLANPVYVIWPDDDIAILHGAHLQPVYIKPQIYASNFNYCIDGDFTYHAIKDLRTIHISQDSEEFCWCDFEINDLRPTDPLPPGPGPDASAIAKWMAANLTELELAFYRREICIHGGGRGGPRHDALSARATPFVDRVLAEVAKYRTCG